jgi:hypothetical protein
MAQIMKYYQYPATSKGTGIYSVTTYKDKNDKEFPLSEFKSLNDKLKVMVEDQVYKAKIKDVTGTDHDMGHTYDWKNISLFAIANIGTLGDIEYDLPVVCSDGKSKVYLEIHD